MKSAWALVCSSVTVVAKQSQLFHPIGGVGAQFRNCGEAVSGAAGSVQEQSMARVAGRTKRNLQRRDMAKVIWINAGLKALMTAERGLKATFFGLS